VNLCFDRAGGLALAADRGRALLVRDPLAARTVDLDLVLDLALAFVVLALGITASL
jgi:hypothetical protein